MNSVVQHYMDTFSLTVCKVWNLKIYCRPQKYFFRPSVSMPLALAMLGHPTTILHMKDYLGLILVELEVSI